MYEKTKSKFSRFKDKPFRQYQEEAIRFVHESTKPICVIQAPTGSGKSLIGMCVGTLFDDFTYVVSSKQLQSQLHQDFPEVEIMKGRNNYDCLLRIGKTCDDCLHSKISPCPYKPMCPYEVQKKRVLNAKWRLLNYHYYLTECNYVGGFSGSSILVCDEGDLLEGLLANFVSLRIPEGLLKRLDIGPPRFKTAEAEHGVESWIDWAQNEAGAKVYRRLSDVQEEMESIGDPDHPDLEGLKGDENNLKTVYNRLEIFVKHVDDNWIFEEKSKSYSFRPTWMPEELSEQYFFRHAERVVLMSATFPPPAILGKLLGRPPGDFDYLEIPSVFPIENRLVYLKPVGNITYKLFDTEAPKILDEINRLLAKHLYEKGIIHAVSYRLSQLIMDNIGIDRLITHNRKNREEVLERFKQSDRPLVLVSPSMERGVDLPDDKCGFIVYAKAPFLSLGDKLTSKRVFGSSIGALWYRSLCAQTIVQGCGRGVRHINDKCVSYLLDEQMYRLVMDSRSLFPKDFIDAVEI